MTNEEILARLHPLMLAQWARLVQQNPKLAHYPVPTIKLNNRFTRTAGRMLVESSVVELGTKFIRYSSEYAEEIMLITMPHELCHQADYNLHGTPANNRWHGPSWRRLMVSMGLSPEPYHTMDIVK